MSAFTTYAATKYAAIGIAEALRAELARSSVGVTIPLSGFDRHEHLECGPSAAERFGGPTTRPYAEGEHWRTRGLDPARIAAETLKAIEVNQPYTVAMHNAAARAFDKRMQSPRSALCRNAIRGNVGSRDLPEWSPARRLADRIARP